MLHEEDKKDLHAHLQNRALTMHHKEDKKELHIHTHIYTHQQKYSFRKWHGCLVEETSEAQKKLLMTSYYKTTNTQSVDQYTTHSSWWVRRSQWERDERWMRKACYGKRRFEENTESDLGFGQWKKRKKKTFQVNMKHILIQKQK